MARRDQLAASLSLTRPSLPALAMCINWRWVAAAAAAREICSLGNMRRGLQSPIFDQQQLPLVAPLKSQTLECSTSTFWIREPTVITLHIYSINIHCRYPNIYVWSTSDSALTTVANIHKNCLLATCHNFIYLFGIILLRSCIVSFIKVSLSLYLQISAAVLRW